MANIAARPEPVIDVPSAFAASYAEARAKFRQAALARGLASTPRVHSHAAGAQGEELAVDVALLGDSDARSMLVLLSGVHGIEGFCGSGCQVALLQDETVLDAVRQSGAAVLFCHAVNPYGFSHLRRTNEDNIDVNRNFRDFSAPFMANAAYASLHSIIVPPTWPPTPGNAAVIGDYVVRYGAAQLQARLHGAMRRCATYCKRTGSAASGSAGSISTQAWGPGAMAKRSMPGPTTRR